MHKVICFQCKHKLELSTKISFREECPQCGADIHACLNCRFYDTSSYNECKEPSAEKVQNKDRNNYCEYFEANTNHSAKDNSHSEKKKKQLTDAEALFKKD